MPSVKVTHPLEASSAAVHLPPVVGINQVGVSDKVGNSIIWQYLPEFFLDVIKAPEVGM